ncbi:MAG: AsmA family protein, partial [Rhodospirillales bacterium]|nr:AsmA family protein [Rhodospirillales bacterium]
SWLSVWLGGGPDGENDGGSNDAGRDDSSGEPEKTNLAELGSEAKARGTGFNIPNDLSGIFKLSVGAINYRGGVARQIGVALRLGDGRVGIENASALLPGGSAIELVGVLAPENSAPRFNGKLTVSSDNLRSLLSWLDVKVDAVPVDRLTRLSYSSSLDITPDAVQIYGAVIALDTLHATGGVSIALQKRLAFGVDIAMDNLILDTYLGVSKDAVVAVKSKAKKTSRLAELKQSLAVLDDIDANFKVMIGKLVWAGKDVEKLSLEGNLFAGELTIKAASIGNYLGTSGTLAGTATGFSRKPEGDLRLDFEFRDSAALGRLAGRELPYPASHLGSGKGILEFKGNEDRITLGLDSVFSGTKLEIHGGIVAPSALPALDITVAMHNGSFASLLKQFNLPLDRPKGKDDGPVAVSLSANGKMSDVKLRTAVEVGGGKLTVDGKVESAFTDPDYRFDAHLKGGDVKKLLRGLGTDFRPAGRNLGGFDVALAITGDHTKASLSGFKGNFGPVTFEGKATANLTGDRPRFEGSLKTTEVIVDLFLPPPTTGLKQPVGNVGPKPDQRWSREKIDLSYLRDFEGELRVESPGVAVGAYDFRDVRAVLTVDGGVATLKPLNARLFDGEAELSLRIDGREVPALGLQLALTNVDVAKAMTASAGIDVLTGRAGFSGEFETAGRSQYQMITALGGGARISAREGLIRGIDLRRLSDRLQIIDKISDVLGVVAGSLSGGQTAYHSVEGVIQVEKGIARATDVRADIDAVDATVTSEMDLANWTMDTKARFQLTDHPKAPPLGVDLRGPINDPVRDLKTRQLEGYLTQLIGTAVLDKLIRPKTATPQSQPGAAAPSQVAPSQAPPSQNDPAPAAPRPPSPEDLLKGILENLP